MTADITVIVPTYNVEKYINKCLKSLHNQSFNNFEVWAVNDGSTDNSKNVIKKWCDIDNRIKYIEKENGGYGSVLQYCISNIKTKYFLICDPDDWLDRKALETLYNIAEKNNVDMVVGDKFNVYSDDNQQEYSSSKPTFLSIMPDEVYNDDYHIQLFSFLLVSPHAKLYKTEISKNIIFPQHVSYTDFDLYILSLINAKRVCYHPQPLAYYLIDRKGNTTTDKSPKIIDYYCKVWDAAYQQLRKNSKNVDVLWWRMYVELQLILANYAETKDISNKQYLNEIYSLIKKLRIYKKNIERVSPKSLKFRILFEGLMSKHLYKFFGYIYMKLK